MISRFRSAVTTRCIAQSVRTKSPVAGRFSAATTRKALAAQPKFQSVQLLRRTAAPISKPKLKRIFVRSRMFRNRSIDFLPAKSEKPESARRVIPLAPRLVLHFHPRLVVHLAHFFQMPKLDSHHQDPPGLAIHQDRGGNLEHMRLNSRFKLRLSIPHLP